MRLSLYKLTVATTLIISLGFISQLAKAESKTILGNSTQGQPIANISTGGKKVEISTSGITVSNGATAEDDDDSSEVVVNSGHSNEKWEDTLVPIAFFTFLIIVILGGKFLASRNERRRLDLLKLMVEKGQSVPEGMMTQILSPQAAPEVNSARLAYRRTRNAYGFTVAGVLMLGHAVIQQDWQNKGVLIPGVIFLCLGLGGLAGIYLPKREEKALN